METQKSDQPIILDSVVIPVPIITTPINISPTHQLSPIQKKDTTPKSDKKEEDVLKEDVSQHIEKQKEDNTNNIIISIPNTPYSSTQSTPSKEGEDNNMELDTPEKVKEIEKPEEITVLINYCYTAFFVHVIPTLLLTFHQYLHLSL